MQYQKTGLPNNKMLVNAFQSGWDRFQKQSCRQDFQEIANIEEAYLKGPAAIAKVIFEYGGDCRVISVAASLAGPAAFSECPDALLDHRVIQLAQHVLDIDADDTDELTEKMVELSPEEKLFLQASAVVSLETLGQELQIDLPEAQESFMNSLKLYGVARGDRDVFNLDTRFELAVRKARTVITIPVTVLQQTMTLKS